MTRPGEAMQFSLLPKHPLFHGYEKNVLATNVYWGFSLLTTEHVKIPKAEA